MNRSARSRALFTCLSLAGCFTAFSFRLVHLQVTMHEEYAERAEHTHVIRQSSQGSRGRILDIHGESLAQNEPLKTVVADASVIKDREELAMLLSGPLQMGVEVLRERLDRTVFSKAKNESVPSPYIVLKKEVAENVAAEIEQKLAAKKLRGIFFEKDARRVYPNEQMLCHVLGYTNGVGTGVEGIERSMESYLCASDGFRYIERDRFGKEIVPYRGDERAARNGSDVRLTIDMGLQNIVETELEAAVKLYRPKAATVILMQPQTGEILALANRPNFNPNSLETGDLEQRRNRAISDQVEPGSTFKIVTTAAALSERLVRPATTVFCENGYYAAYKLHDHAPYGDLSVTDILVHSSNIGAAKLAIQLGDQKFYEYVRRFGFGERTGVNLPREIGGVVHPPHTWTKISISRMPMGQEVAATPLQIVSAMSAIANGGHLMMPQIVHDIVDADGKQVVDFPPQEVRCVATKEATDALREALCQVVSPRGTASLAQVPGHKVAGKTGTAQKPGADGYNHSRYVVSFVGFMPVDHPAFVALVLFDEADRPPHENVGGMVAAPVFAKIAEKAARYLGLPPDQEIPSVAGSAGAPAGPVASDFRDQ